LIDQLENSAGMNILNPVSTPSITPSGKNVFIIHGHDELNTKRLTLLLQNLLHLNPIVIISKPGMSRPLIDKYEDSAAVCSFAFAIVTPDDEVASSSSSYRQARPNVIFELGWFVGRLGKHRVTILLKEGTTIHSDIDGVSRIQFRDNVEDKYLEIQRELAAAGIIEKENTL
jgi:predicted nucleotide-binding protein